MLKIEDRTKLLTVKFAGRGGMEKQIVEIFPSLSRTHKKKFDFVCSEDAIVYEAKKQQNLQWFNISKFYNLSRGEQRINLLFVCVDSDGLADLIFCIEKGDFVRILVNDKDTNKSGWTYKAIELAYQLVQQAPAVQPKGGIRMREFIKKHREDVDIIHER